MYPQPVEVLEQEPVLPMELERETQERNRKSSLLCVCAGLI